MKFSESKLVYNTANMNAVCSSLDYVLYSSVDYFKHDNNFTKSAWKRLIQVVNFSFLTFDLIFSSQDVTKYTSLEYSAECLPGIV